MTELTSAEATRQATAQHADDPFLVFMTIDHATLSEPIRIVRNLEDVTSNGNLFTAYPFQLQLATDGEDNPTGRITVANVSRDIGRALEALIEPPTVTIELALASTPDTIERSWSQFELSDAAWDAFRVTGTLQQQAYWDEPWPKLRVTERNFPGMFK